MRRLLAGVGIVFLTGCSFEPALPTLPGEPKTQGRFADLPHHPSDRGKLRAELQAASMFWHKARPAAYELTVSVNCFCPAPTPFVSRVSGRTIERTAGGVWAHDGQVRDSQLQTVESLFIEAARAMESDADDVTVQLDPQFHFPARIRIDRWRDAIDDEAEWVAHLQAIR